MIELLESKIQDPVVREAFRRVKSILSDLESRVDDGSGGGDVINTIIAASVWKKVNVSALASATTVLDKVSVNDFKTLKYIVSVRDNTNNKTGTFEITIKNENGSLADSVFAKISGGISFSANVANNAGFMELSITNNEVVNLAINSAKLTL